MVSVVTGTSTDEPPVVVPVELSGTPLVVDVLFAFEDAPPTADAASAAPPVVELLLVAAGSPISVPIEPVHEHKHSTPSRFGIFVSMTLLTGRLQKADRRKLSEDRCNYAQQLDRDREQETA
jgi:hypothetical protein